MLWFSAKVTIRFKESLIFFKQLVIEMIYNHGYNTFRLFDILANFPLTTREMKRDY